MSAAPRRSFLNGLLLHAQKWPPQCLACGKWCMQQSPQVTRRGQRTTRRRRPPHTSEPAPPAPAACWVPASRAIRASPSLSTTASLSAKQRRTRSSGRATRCQVRMLPHAFDPHLLAAADTHVVCGCCWTVACPACPCQNSCCSRLLFDCSMPRMPLLCVPVPLFVVRQVVQPLSSCPASHARSGPPVEGGGLVP